MSEIAENINVLIKLLTIGGHCDIICTIKVLTFS